MAPESRGYPIRRITLGWHYQGHEGVRKFLGSLASIFESRSFVERLIDCGDEWLRFGRTVGKPGRRSWSSMCPSFTVWTFSEAGSRDSSLHRERHDLAALGM